MEGIAVCILCMLSKVFGRDSKNLDVLQEKKLLQHFDGRQNEIFEIIAKQRQEIVHRS